MIGKLACNIAQALGGCQRADIIVLPPPTPCGLLDAFEASSILLDKLDELKDTQAAIHLPDMGIKKYKKSDIVQYLNLDETDQIPYLAENHDCDDFAAELYGKFAGLVWTMPHALNFFFDEVGTLWFLEPQSDKMARTLENWQGWDVRFFLAR